MKYDEDKFQITLDCAHYRPEELDVKVEGNTIIITAKQVRRSDLIGNVIINPYCRVEVVLMLFDLVCSIINLGQ